MLKDARVLEEGWVPRELHHREGQIQSLSSQLQPLTHGLSSENVLVTGPSGTGKTTIAKYVVQKLNQQALDVRSGYVNCLSNSTKVNACHALLQDAGRANDLRPEGTSASIYLNRLRELDQEFVAILDEVDVLEDDTLLHALHDLRNVTLILIAVSEDELFADLDTRVVSRLRGCATISLSKYHHDELCDILDGRINAGLRAGVVEKGVVDRIADLAAGDARHGITLLRRSVSEALQEDAGQLSFDHVESARHEARQRIHDHHVETLGTHQRHLYEIIKDVGEISASDLHGRYEQRVSDPKPRSTRRNYLQSLQRYELIYVNGQGRGTRYVFAEP
ncbi:Cdc6/Cdc18 family protein [Haloplanus sp. C73]|uniref:Cdc6/Cdc18 family protein n=1 Tax=Haloplanus sp. C73 TaxID=3421641 RepID=UPI003EB7F4AB